MAEAEKNRHSFDREFLADEPLLNAPKGAEAAVSAIIAPLMRSLEFRLVRVRLLGLNGITLQIMAERFDGSMTIEDCELLSQNISPLLDVEDVIDKHYHLEISSPGMDRPLVRKSDFAAWRGHLAKIETHTLVEGKKKFRGIIVSANDEHIILRSKDKDNNETEAAIPFAQIAEANLVLTDILIRSVLQQDKKKKKES